MEGGTYLRIFICINLLEEKKNFLPILDYCPGLKEKYVYNATNHILNP